MGKLYSYRLLRLGTSHLWGRGTKLHRSHPSRIAVVTGVSLLVLAPIVAILSHQFGHWERVPATHTLRAHWVNVEGWLGSLSHTYGTVEFALGFVLAGIVVLVLSHRKPRLASLLGMTALTLLLVPVILSLPGVVWVLSFIAIAVLLEMLVRATLKHFSYKHRAKGG